LLAVLGHPQRIQIIEELREGECDVTSLQERLGIRHCGVSQHLMLLRARRIVSERREGRHVYYRLRHPEIASWLLNATEFLEQESETIELREAIRKTRMAWAAKRIPLPFAPASSRHSARRLPTSQEEK
jgi:DNA-binding transcriptional ArsR family regulator